MVNERTADGPPSLIDVLEACRVAQSYKVDADRWRRAHEIVERERDQAREERDDAEQRYRDTAKALTEWHGRWVEMERDRDEWKARAEAAEARTTPAVTREEVAGKLRQALNVFGTSDDHLLHIADNVLTLFGVEAGQATDPVEELAGQIESAAREAIRKMCDALVDVAPALNPLTVERAMELTAASRKVAAHVLGQEGRHVDQ